MNTFINPYHEVWMRYGIAGRTLGTLALMLGAGTAVAQTPSPVTVGGVAYAQYLYQFNDTANHQNAFDITRAYINIIGKLADGLVTRITPDIFRAADGSLNYRLKYAYAAWTPNNSALTYKIGQFTTPWLDWEEALWDYRMQGPMALDRSGYLSSSDLGLGADGAWGGDRVNMQVGVFDGEGYHGGAGDQRKDVMGRVSVRLYNTDDNSKVGGLRLTGYAQYGKPTGGGQRQRYIGMLSYRSKMYTLAGEFAATRDSSTTAATPQVDGRVMSFYGVVKIPQSKAGVIGRVDVVDPNTDAASNTDRLTRFIGGASYQLTPNLRLLGDVELNSYQGTPTAAQDAAKTQGYFQVQFTF